MDKISRRNFIKLGATTTAVGAAVMATHRGVWALLDRQNGSMAIRNQVAAAGSLEEIWVKTSCALCPAGCGLDVRVVNGRAVKIEGNPLHPLNQGVCCLKGQAALEVLYSPERIEHPRLQTGERGSGDWAEISWDDALAMVAEHLTDLRQQGQAHTVAFMHGETRGQMRALINRFMAAYGSPNVISRHSQDEQAARLGMFLTQGINGLPVYDLNNARYVMTFGGNLLESSRHVIGYLGALAFMRRGRPDRGKLVAVHPRLSLTGVKADEWVPIRPGTYGALALGMANVIINSKLYDETFVRDFTFGFEDFKDEDDQPHQGFKNLVLERYPLDRAAAITGVPAEIIARLAGEFATNRPAVAIMPTEPGGLSSDNSLYTAMAIHALNALIGAIDAPGGVLVQRFPQLADWPEFTLDATAQTGLAQERVDAAGSAELLLALSAYQNVAGRLLAGQPYPVNTLFLYNTNPVYDAPDGRQFAQALKQIPFVVSFASVLDESAAHANLILPASTFLELWGDDYLEGTGYAGVSLRQPVIEPVHDTRNPGDVLLDLAARVGQPVATALPWATYQALVQHRLSGIDMDWDKFESNGVWSEMVYFNAAPGSPAWAEVVGRDRLNAPQDGRFDFFSRELFAALVAPTDLDCLPHFDTPPTITNDSAAAAAYPFLLVAQTLITQPCNWDGIVPTLEEAYGLQTNMKWSSWVEINPRAAESLGVQNGDLVWVESVTGRVQAPVRLFEGIWPNAVYLPPGQGHRTLVKWGRDSGNNRVVGVNPNQLVTAGTSPTRVKIYKA
ncbi:MAG: Thiosulfate reductase molybdopterin-containing subunit PhsA [Anaerolineae bacterium]|nr:Thiosulfate reductase molybdopterin-containing subunit PhsA [Anaerolineae bacterium]